MVSVTDDSLLGIVPGLLLPKVIVMGKSTNFIATIVFFRTSFCNFQECYLIPCFFINMNPVVNAHHVVRVC